MRIPLLETEVPPEIPEPVRSELRAEYRMQMARRLQFVAFLLVGFLALYAVADYFVSPQYLGVLYTAKSVQVAIVVATMWWLRRNPTHPAVGIVCVLATSSVYVLVAVQSTAIGDLLTVPLTCVLVGLISATVMYWGASAQLCTQIVAALCVAVNLALSNDAAASLGYQHIAIVGGLIAPVFLARRFDEDRRASWRASWALRDSERRFRELVETNKSLVYQIEFGGRVLYISPRIVEYGYDANEIVGRSMIEFMHPDDVAPIAEALSAAVQGNPQPMEFRMRSAAGEYRWFRTFGVAVAREDGDPAINGTMTDITEQRRAEEQKAALLAVAEDLGGALDLDSILARVHARMTALIPCDVAMTFQLDAARNLYRAIAEHGSRDRHEELMKIEVSADIPLVRRVLEEGAVLFNDPRTQAWVPEALVEHFGIGSGMCAPLEIRGSHVLGAVFVFNRSGRPFDDSQMALFQGMARQLSVAMEAASLYLRQKETAAVSAALSRFGEALIAAGASEDLLEILCRQASEELGCDFAVAYLLDDDEVEFVPVATSGLRTPEWETLQLIRYPLPLVMALTAGLEKEELVELSVTDTVELLPPAAIQQMEDAGITRMMFMGLRQGDRLLGILQCGYRSRDEGFTDEQRNVARGIARMIPLSLATASLVEEVGRANEVKSHFVATLSHELRNLVAALRGYTFFLRSGGRLGEQDANAVVQAEACARELGELVNATLDLSRFEARRVPLDVQEAPLAALLGEMAREVRPQLDAKKLEIELRVSDDAGSIRTDPMKLRMALRNLLTNAVKFTERGSVTLEARASGDGIEIRVEDSGAGIPAEALATIFEPFEQAHGAESRRKGGAGLGLYLVRRLVTILGGSVTVESEVGRGSTFRILLPRDVETDTREEAVVRSDRPVRAPRAATARKYVTAVSSPELN